MRITSNAAPVSAKTASQSDGLTPDELMSQMRARSHTQSSPLCQREEDAQPGLIGERVVYVDDGLAHLWRRQRSECELDGCRVDDLDTARYGIGLV